LRVFSYSS